MMKHVSWYISVPALAALVVCTLSTPSSEVSSNETEPFGANRLKSSSTCAQPFVAYPTEELLNTLSKNLADSQKYLVAISVLFTDASGTLFEPGSCPHNPPPFAALDLGLPLLWFIRRGRYGSVFTKLPPTQLQLYVIGNPLEKFKWVGQLNVTAKDHCWRSMDFTERANRLARVMSPFLQNSSALSEGGLLRSELCFRIPQESHRQLSVVSIQAQLNSQGYVCCRLPICRLPERLQTKCPQVCDKFEQDDPYIIASLHLSVVIVFYITLFLLPLPALWLQNQVIAAAATNQAEDVSKKGSSVAKQLDTILGDDQGKDRYGTMISMFFLMCAFFAWMAIDVFYLVPTRTASYNSFDRSCKITALPVVVLTLALTVLTLFMCSAVYGMFCIQSSMCTKSQNKLSCSFKACQTVSLPFIVPLFFGRSVSLFLKACKRCKKDCKKQGYLVLRLFFVALMFPISLLMMVTRVLFFVPAVNFLANGWERTAEHLHHLINSDQARRHVGCNCTLVWERFSNGQLGFLPFCLYNVMHLLAVVASVCLIWSSWLALFDTISFIIFTFLAHVVTNTAVTMYVVTAIGSVLFQVSRQVRRLGHSYTRLHDAVTDLNDPDGRLGSDLAEAEKELDIRLQNCREKKKSHVQDLIRDCVGSEEEVAELTVTMVTLIEKMTIYEEFYIQSEQGFLSWETGSKEEQLQQTWKQAAGVESILDGMFLSLSANKGSYEDVTDDNTNISLQTDNLLETESQQVAERESYGCWHRRAQKWSVFKSRIERTASQWFVFLNWILQEAEGWHADKLRKVQCGNVVESPQQTVQDHSRSIELNVVGQTEQTPTTAPCAAAASQSQREMEHSPAVSVHDVRMKLLAYDKLIKWKRTEQNLRLVFFLLLLVAVIMLFLIYAVILTQDIFRSVTMLQYVLVTVVIGGIPQLSHVLHPTENAALADRVKLKKRLLRNLRKSIGQFEEKEVGKPGHRKTLVEHAPEKMTAGDSTSAAKVDSLLGANASLQ